MEITKLKIEKANRTPTYINQRCSQRHILFQLLKINDKEFSRKPAGKDCSL